MINKRYAKLLLPVFLFVLVLTSPISVFASGESVSEDLKSSAEISRQSDPPQITSQSVVEIRLDQETNTLFARSANSDGVSTQDFRQGILVAYGVLTASKNLAYAYADLTISSVSPAYLISYVNGTFTWNNGTPTPGSKSFINPPATIVRDQSQYSISAIKSGKVDWYGYIKINGETIYCEDVLEATY